MPHAGNGEVCADVGVWFAFYEEVRVEKDEVSGGRRHLGVQLAHHVRQETMFAWHYHLQSTATVNQLLSSCLSVCLSIYLSKKSRLRRPQQGRLTYSHDINILS